ncbi:Uncharacterised protein [uncultured archaeon]|nr:Uncharacterised protein [uncultured archaeon]
MVVSHISEVLREFYEDRAREDLDSITVNGLSDILDSGAEHEIAFLLQCNAFSSYEIKRAQHEYLVNTLWRN